MTSTTETERMPHEPSGQPLPDWGSGLDLHPPRDVPGPHEDLELARWETEGGRVG